jgi:hypothetical protein
MTAAATDRSTASGGIGFTGALTLVFIVLKLTDNIDWSWWWVLSPIWITAAVAVILLLVRGRIAAVTR